MRPEQQLNQEQLLSHERSFTDVCVPELMSLATQNKYSVSLLVQDLPTQWQHSDRVLVAVFPTLREDVEAFYAGKGRSMSDMFAPHQLLSIDEGARITLLQKLAGKPQTRSHDDG